jgi:hypothetical protein
VLTAAALDELVSLDTMTRQAADFLEAAVASGLNISWRTARRQVQDKHLSGADGARRKCSVMLTESAHLVAWSA